MLANERYICPFCAYVGTLKTFIVKKESGEYSKKTFQCPYCMQIMRRNTLLMAITPREWAMWLYASIRIFNKPHEKFYDRIAKNDDGTFVLAERIKNMGMADNFWDGWKEAKKLNIAELGAIVNKIYISDKVQTKLGNSRWMLNK